MAQHFVHHFRSLVTWAKPPRPERRHRRGHRRPTQAHPAVRPGTPQLVVLPPHAAEVTAPAPLRYPSAPTLRHLGVVGLPGTVGAAAAMATARLAAERRFMGADPRAGGARGARGARPRA